MDILIALMYTAFGMGIASLLIFFLGKFFKSDLADLREKLEFVRADMKAANDLKVANDSYYRNQLKELKATPNKSVEINDTMVYLNRRQDELWKDYQELTSRVNSRLVSVEIRMADLSPYHRHLHMPKAKAHKKPLLPKSDKPLEYTPTMGSEL